MLKDFILITTLYPSLSPITSIKVAITYCFSNMLALDMLRMVEVGNSAGNFQDAAVGSGRERETLHCHTKHLNAGLIGFGILVDEAFGHLSVAMNARMSVETGLLNLSGGDDAGTNVSRWFARRSLRDVLERYGRNFNLNVDAVHQRAGDARHIAGNLAGRADTRVRRVAVITTRTRVARRHKHERAGQRERVFCPADSDFAVFERLAHHFECLAVELCELVEKEHPMVGEADLTGLGVDAATDQGYFGDGVVWCAEGALRDERRAATELSGDAVDLCGL